MSACDLEPQHGMPEEPPAPADGHSNDADADEELSGLMPLLEPMPLAEIRDIARQRGWQLKGVAKADCISELSTLLCDPTETARAVMELPEPLREALRAAFVADDGGGMTATTVAQAMTALRNSSVPPIKPVEAAGLLSDLGRWGLILPWRDSLYGNGSYVLPWEVQRLVPPLPGWCSSEPGPAAPTSFLSGPQVVNSLVTVWEDVAACLPAVRPEPETLSERPLQSMAQGWPYEPREPQDPNSRRGRAAQAAYPVFVRAVPFLLDGVGLQTLGRRGADDGFARSHLPPDERLDFLCRVLGALGLARVQNGHLVAERGAMADWSRHTAAEQQRTMGQAYLSIMEWSELDLLLRRDERLVLWHKPSFPLSYDQFRSSLVRLRHLVLRFLACAGEQGWCRIADLATALRELWPHFAAALQGDKRSWFAQAWGLSITRKRSAETAPATQADSGSYPADTRPGFGEGPALDTVQSPDWESAQGAFLRLILEGPLFWLGFAELSYKDGGDQPVAVRFHGLSDWVWDRPTAGRGRQTMEAMTIDTATGAIAMPPTRVLPEAYTFLGRIARLTQASAERYLFELSPRAAYATFESGVSLTDLLLEWERVMPRPIPAAVQDTLGQWWAKYAQVRLYDGFGLLELCDEVTLRELEASTSLSRHIVARLSPRRVLVPDDAVDDLMREFAAKGYTPKVMG